MGNCLSISRFSKANNVPDLPSARPTSPPATTQPSNTPSPLPHQKYDVFISHAGEDKATIAIPLREKLMKHGITAFVDEKDIEGGADAPQAMIDAMETASIAVVVLSPEFVARKWPIKELLCLLGRLEEDGSGNCDVPVIIPFFYRLTIDDLYKEPRLDRRDKDGNRLYKESRFFERMKNGEPEADIATIKASLRRLHRNMGVRNDVQASNDTAHIMYLRREVLLRELLVKIQEAVVRTNPLKSNMSTGERSGTDNVFQAYFDTTQDTVDLILDFSYENKDENACSQEAKLLKTVLNVSRTKEASISVKGIGGVGKTSLVRAISRLDKVKRHFEDGVHYLSLGKDGTKRDLMEELSKAVERSGGREQGASLRREEKLDDLVRGFHMWFKNRKCLFIVDDVWQTREISAIVIHRLLILHVSGEGSKVLLTTRSRDIASRANIRFGLEPRGTTDIESRRILLQYAGVKPENAEDHKVMTEILEQCSGLPLFLAIAGKAINSKAFRRGHEGCAAYHAYAASLRWNLQSMFTTDVDLHERLDASLKISLNLLEERMQDFSFQLQVSVREMYRRLSVVKKKSKVPMTMLKFLWELEDESQAAVIAGEFDRIGLVDVEFERRKSGQIELLGLHDSLHEFAVMETRKVHDGERVGHDALLRGYGHDLAISDGCHEWWHTSIEADGYIHQNLCRHLVGAGRPLELVNLLLRPQWTERQVNLSGQVNISSILSLVADFSIGITSLEGRIRETRNEELSVLKEALELISDAIELAASFISNNIVEMWFQLQGRLICYCERNKAIQYYVACIETLGARPIILCKTSCLGEPGTSNTRIVSIGKLVTCMVMMNDEERIACGSLDGRIFIVNVKRSEVENHWQAHDEPVEAIVVGTDGTRLVSGSEDNTAKVWKVENGELLTCFSDHNSSVIGVTLMGDEKRAISVSEDGTGCLWDVETGQVLSKPTRVDAGRGITCMTPLPYQDDVVVTGDWDGKLKMWNIKTGAQLAAFDGHEHRVECLTVTPDGRHVVSGSGDETAKVWDVGSHQQIGHSLELEHEDMVTCMAVSGDGRRLVSGTFYRKIRVWDFASQTEICEPLEGHVRRISGVSFLGRGNRLVSSAMDGTVRMWDVTRRFSKELTTRHESRVTGVSFTPDGRFVVSGSYDYALRVWDSISGQPVGYPLDGHLDRVTDVAVTPDGQCVVSVSWDRTVRVWDLESRNLLHTLNGHSECIRCVAVTPQGDRIVTGSDDGTVRIRGLPVTDGDPVVLDGHSASVRRVFVSDDGWQVVSVDAEDNIFVWELETLKTIQQYEKEDGWRLSRGEVLRIVGEITAHDDTILTIPRYSRQIVYNEGPKAIVLATLDANIDCWALSPDKETICVGLEDGQVAFLKLERQ